MLLHCSTTGNHYTQHPPAIVAQNSWWDMVSCPKSGFPSITHNEIRDVTASLLTEVCNEVCVEPKLQPITGETLTGATCNVQNGARLDISANGSWEGWFEKTYFDVRVFNPHAPSNHQCSSLSSCYRKHETLKKRAYQQRMREVEHASSHPLSSQPLGKWPVKILFLQEIGFMSGYKVGPILLLHLPPDFSPPSPSNSMHQGCSRQPWLCG